MSTLKFCFAIVFCSIIIFLSGCANVSGIGHFGPGETHRVEDAGSRRSRSTGSSRSYSSRSSSTSSSTRTSSSSSSSSNDVDRAVSKARNDGVIPKQNTMKSATSWLLEPLK